MTFNIMTIRTDDEPDVELYPFPAGEPNQVEPLPGEQILGRYLATGFRIVARNRGEPREVGKMSKLKAPLTVTDQRMTLACSRFDKGGSTWIGFGVGGIAIAAAATTVGRVRAKRRNAGKMLVGHVRHSWLGRVDATSRRRVGTHNRLELFLADPTAPERVLMLEVDLENRFPASEVAQLVVCAAVEERLLRNYGPSERDRLQGIANAARANVDADACSYALGEGW